MKVLTFSLGLFVVFFAFAESIDLFNFGEGSLSEILAPHHPVTEIEQIETTDSLPKVENEDSQSKLGQEKEEVSNKSNQDRSGHDDSLDESVLLDSAKVERSNDYTTPLDDMSPREDPVINSENNERPIDQAVPFYNLPAGEDFLEKSEKVERSYDQAAPLDQIPTEERGEQIIIEGSDFDAHQYDSFGRTSSSDLGEEQIIASVFPLNGQKEPAARTVAVVTRDFSESKVIAEDGFLTEQGTTSPHLSSQDSQNEEKPLAGELLAAESSLEDIHMIPEGADEIAPLVKLDEHKATKRDEPESKEEKPEEKKTEDEGEKEKEEEGSEESVATTTVDPSMKNEQNPNQNNVISINTWLNFHHAGIDF